MAMKLNNDLNIDINVFFKFNGNRRAAFIRNESHVPQNGKKELNFSGIGRGVEYELHVEMTHIPFGDSINGVEIDPGSLGKSNMNTFKLFHHENNEGNVVYTFVIKLKGKEEFVGNEPQVLHPEDKPIIPLEGG